MAWYKAGTAGVTQGSPTVTGAGTLWVSGARIGHQWIGPDGLSYEIVNIASDTQLTIDPPYRGATAGGQTYRIAPTQDEVATAGRVMAELIGTFAVVRDTIGQGLIPDGTVAAPGIRFTADQDTGFRRTGANGLALVTGGVDRLTIADTFRVNGLPVRHDGPANGAGTYYQFALNGAPHSIIGSDGGIFGAAPNDLGIFVYGTNNFYVATNAQKRLVVDLNGNVGIGVATPGSLLHLRAGNAAQALIQNLSGEGDCAVSFKTPSKQWNVGINVGGVGAGVLTFYDVSRGTAPVLIDSGGNLLVGVSSGPCHFLCKPVDQGAALLKSYSTANNQGTMQLYAVGSGYGGINDCAAEFGKHSTSNRSIRAVGTVNASGADYAEYMRKAGACGVLAKGQIVGIDAKGLLTDRFSLAHSFVIKSTDPAYVGGDTWSPGPSPAEPVLVLPPYNGPAEPREPGAAPAALPILADRPVEPVRGAGEEDLAFIRRMAGWIVADAAWVAAMDARPAQVEAQAMAESAHVDAAARYKVDLAAWRAAIAAHAAEVAAAEKKHAAAVEQYRTDKAAWDARMEAARQCVDRVAFSGQVPCNVAAGTFKPGDYIVGAKGKNDEIVGLVVTNAAMRLNPGARCDAVGKVWRVLEDGRAWVAVLIG